MPRHDDRPREIIWTPEISRWLGGLPEARAETVAATAKLVLDGGPGLGRPLADHVRGSKHHNMKEMRVPGGNLRALFAFDPRRRLVMLVGGDKTNDWNGWYKRNIRRADQIYDRHLRGMGDDPRWGRGMGPKTPTPRGR